MGRQRGDREQRRLLFLFLKHDRFQSASCDGGGSGVAEGWGVPHCCSIRQDAALRIRAHTTPCPHHPPLPRFASQNNPSAAAWALTPPATLVQAAVMLLHPPPGCRLSPEHRLRCGGRGSAPLASRQRSGHGLGCWKSNVSFYFIYLYNWFSCLLAI